MEHSQEFLYKQDQTFGHRIYWRRILDEARLDPTTADIPAWVQRAGVWVLLSDVAAIEILHLSGEDAKVFTDALLNPSEPNEALKKAAAVTPVESVEKILVADSAANALESFGTEVG